MNPNKERQTAVDALLARGFRVQLHCEDFTLLAKPNQNTSAVKLIQVDNDGKVENKTLSTFLEELVA